VPCCNKETGKDCNGKLNDLFEQPYQQQATSFWKAAFDGPPQFGTALASADRPGVSKWFLKTVLLLFHPERCDWLPHTDRPDEQLLHDAPTAWSWMTNHSSTGPDDMHLWVTTSQPGPPRATKGMSLLSWNDSNKGHVQQRVIEIGIANLHFTLLYHPGGTVDLRGDTPGIQLWPALNQPLSWVDLSKPACSIFGLSAMTWNILELAPSADPWSNPWTVPHPLLQRPDG